MGEVKLEDDLERCTFPVKHPSAYNGPFPPFREPSEIGCFSLDGEREFHPNNHQMKFLAMPPARTGLRMDLNVGHQQAVRKDFPTVERLDNLLRFVLLNQSTIISNFAKPNTPKNQRFGVDFVCYRGLLTELVCTLYENREDWLICATKFRGTIYLCGFPTEQRLQQEQNRSAKEMLMSFWGYKFEQYMTCDQPNGQPNTDVPVNEKEEYCICVKGRLGNHSLLFAAETDCIENSTPRRYAELKTSRIISTERQHQNFCRYKLVKWWAQSFLIGIPKVICGFRDDEGIVRKIDVFPVGDMSKMGEGLWSASAGMNFCNTFLEFVKSFVVKDNPNVVYKFYHKPGYAIECEELPSAGEYQILPEWYTGNF